MYNIFIILKGCLIVFIIYTVSFIVEKVTGLKLLIDNFFWKKSINMAKGAALNNSIFIFLLTNIIVLIVDLSKYNKNPEEYNFFVWLVLLIFLTIAFGKIYYTFTGKDPNKKDDDYT